MINKKNIPGKFQIILYLLALIGIGLIMYRLLAGFGAVTNLSDGYPWGLWIAIDVMTGIAMTTGGLIVASLVLVFGREKYRPLLRPAILTALLGYVLEIIGLVPDLGRPWMLWTLFYSWNNESVMFLVGWCVVMQAIVLATIIAPIFFEKFKWFTILKAYHLMVPWVGVILISFFAFLISGSWIWTFIALITFTALYFIFKSTVKQDAILLLFSIFGIMISISHQTALGALFILIPESLSGLWYSPFLQINFLITAFALGLAMIIFESTLSARAFGFGLESNLLARIAKALPWALAVALVTRFVTLGIQTGFNFAEAGTAGQNVSFWIEVIIGLVLPFALLLSTSIRKSANALFIIACMVLFGVVMSRINVTWIGINAVDYANYRPYILELMITAGIFAMGLLVFYYIGKRYPIFIRHND